jgi:hypothetical protein
MNPWDTEQPEPKISVADLALFADADNMDFFAEELEFYQWLLEIDENEKEDHNLHRPDVSHDRSPNLVCGTGGSIAG